MLMVVFGAGASYDSVPSRPPSKFSSPFRLPLANELFADRYGFNVTMGLIPKCQPVIPYLRQPSEASSVELELERLKNEALTYSERHKQLAAVQFYLQSMLWECENNWKREVAKADTNYKTLLDQIEMWRREAKEKVCLVTFNYDKMLEDALPTVGIKIREVAHYITNNDYKIIKLHGSVNWAHNVNTEIKDIGNRPTVDIANELIERRTDLNILQDFLIVKVPLADPGMRLLSDTPLFPALAIPVENKQNYECPQEHIDALRACIPEVTRILLIGWRATEKVFLQSLKDNLRGRVKMMAVNGSEASSKESLSRLVDEGIQGTLLVTKSGFSDFVTRREVDDILRLT